MQIGISGLPYSGKTTLFSTLLAHRVHDETSKQKTGAERGIVTVPDDRLDRLTKMYSPQKQVNATIEYLKIPGLERDGPRSSGFPPQFLANMKTVDLILIMVRAFENEMYPHPMQTVDARRDINFIESEFLLNDLAIVENRIEKLEKLVMKTQEEKEKRELSVLKTCHKHLEEERPLRDIDFSEQEKFIIRGFQFLSAKQVLYVINISETDIGRSDEIIAGLKEHIHPRCGITALSAEIESEISQLNKADADAFLDDLGIKEPATLKLISASYELLGVYSFFTVGDDECRAWTIPSGTKVQKAAGTIHTDLEKGFIRAEVVPYEILLVEGSMQACKEKGVLRLEGKQYIVKDGDVISVRFNV